MDDLMILSLITGVGLAFMLAPLGCFLVWRRIAFFGDALSHTTLLGISFAILLKLDILWGILAIALLFSLVLGHQLSRSKLSDDTELAIITYGSLAFSMILFSKSPTSISPEAFLFGDLLTTTWQDIYLIYAGAFLVGIILWRVWSGLLLMTIAHDLAKVENVPTRLYSYLLTILLALCLSLSVQSVGALLVPALLIIPSATASMISSSPEKMVGFSILIGVLCFGLGIPASFYFDLPSSATVVASAIVLFTVMQLIQR